MVDEWRGSGGQWVRLNPEYERDGKKVNTVAHSNGQSTFTDTYKHRPEAQDAFDRLVRAYKGEVGE